MSAQVGTVVVGVDGSPGAEAALRWAVSEARARHAPVRLVCVYRWELAYGWSTAYVAPAEVDLEHNRKVAEQLVAMAASQAAELAADVEVSGEAVDGSAIPVLVDESTRAALVVLGSRQLEALGSAVLGSVSTAVAARAACPVVVVRGAAGDPNEHAAVVVGVDGTDASPAVLEFGFGHASRHAVSLRAVLCWRPDVLAAMQWRPEPPPPQRAAAWLAEALAGWSDKYPDVQVHRSVVREHPVSGLVTESAAQYLLVVGSRGRHAFAGALLGSVSQGVLHHASCPVAVVPSHTA